MNHLYFKDVYTKYGTGYHMSKAMIHKYDSMHATRSDHDDLQQDKQGPHHLWHWCVSLSTKSLTQQQLKKEEQHQWQAGSQDSQECRFDVHLHVLADKHNHTEVGTQSITGEKRNEDDPPSHTQDSLVFENSQHGEDQHWHSMKPEFKCCHPQPADKFF